MGPSSNEYLNNEFVVGDANPPIPLEGAPGNNSSFMKDGLGIKHGAKQDGISSHVASKHSDTKSIEDDRRT